MIIIDFLYNVLGTPLGYIMWPIYLLVQNFGWAIIIFTLIVKLAMLPLTIKQQKNMAFSQLFAPKVKEIQQKYRNNREKQAEEMQKLQQQGYNPTGGCGPLVITFLILFGIIDVVYKPFTHMEHIASADISAVSNIAQQTDYAVVLLNDYNKADAELILKYKNGDASAILITESSPKIDHPFKDDENYKSKYNEKDPTTVTTEQRELYGTFTDDQFSQIIGENSRISDQTKQRLITVKQNYIRLQKELFAIQTYNKYPDTFKASNVINDDVKTKLDNISKNMMFFGINLGDTPTFAWDLLIIIPILSFLFSIAQTLLTQYYNKLNNPEMANMGGMKVMLYLMPLFSLWIVFQVPAGVGFYWTINYVFGIVQSIVMQKFYNPQKLREQAKIKFEKRREVTTTAVVTDSETGEEKVVETKETLSQKEINRRKLAAARKADAEKYGEEYNEQDDD